MTDKIHVFISYSRQDFDFVQRLRDALDENGIKHWIDQKDLPAGTPSWEQALRDAIEASYAVIYVGSENARKSSYVRDEIALATAYKVSIFPVWAGGEAWIQCVPLGYGGWQYVDLRHDNFKHNVDKLLREIKKETSEIVVTPSDSIVLPIATEPRNPYKGLNAFTDEDVADFFGRDELITHLIEAVNNRITAGQDQLLTIIGASGSGKSSVVMAGLLPKLKMGAIPKSDQWTYLKPMVPGDHPVQALNRVLLDTPELDVSMKTIDEDLQHPNGMGLYRLARKISKQPVVLYVDQFEELFMTGVTEDERQQFISLLIFAATQPHSPILILLTLRADFYGPPMNYPELGRLVQSYNVSVLPMSIADLRDTVEKPAVAAGLSFESGLVADIIFDLRDDKNAQSGALPLLQYTLEQLYERRSGQILTIAAYKDIGGVRGAIGAHAEKVFKTLDKEVQMCFGLVFQALVHVDDRGTPTRKRETETILTNQFHTANLVEALIKKARVLRVYTEKVGDIPYVEVAHEALLISWQRLADWIKSSNNDLRLIQEMKAAAARWASEGYPEHRLWSHGLLQPVYDALERLPQSSLTTDELAFIQPEAERLLESFKKARSHVQLTMVEREFTRIGEKAIPILVQTYAYVDDISRDAITYLLWTYPYTTFNSVQKAIEYQDITIQIGACRLIGELGLSKLVVYLNGLLNDKDLRVRQAAVNALMKAADASSVNVLLNAIRGKNKNVKDAAAKTLIKVVDVSSIDELLNGLKDTNTDVRQATIMALDKVGTEDVVDALLAALKDFDRSVRRVAATALGKIGNNRGVIVLLNALNDESTDVRQAAAEALGKIRDASTSNALLAVLKDPDRFVQQTAAKALIQTVDASSVEILLNALKDESIDVRQAVAEALVQAVDASSVGTLLNALKDDYTDVRQAAALALGKIGDRNSVEALLKVIKDSDEDVRQAATEALVQAADENNFDLLENALNDIDKNVREAAADGLKKLNLKVIRYTYQIS